MTETGKPEAGRICGFVTTADHKGVVAHAEVQLSSEPPVRRGRPRDHGGETPRATRTTRTDAAGRYEFECEPDSYSVHCSALGQPQQSIEVTVAAGEIVEADPLI